MNEKEILTKKMIKVRMNEVKISKDDKPIIGTAALATCVGILLYSETNKRAIVAHVSDDLEKIITETLMLIDENKLDNSFIKYKIIPGYYHNHYEIKKELENFYSSLHHLFVPFDKDEIPANAIQIDEKTKSCEFAFDASTGKFVTDQIIFEEIDLREENEIDEAQIK